MERLRNNPRPAPPLLQAIGIETELGIRGADIFRHHEIAALLTQCEMARNLAGNDGLMVRSGAWRVRGSGNAFLRAVIA